MSHINSEPGIRRRNPAAVQPAVDTNKPGHSVFGDATKSDHTGINPDDLAGPVKHGQLMQVLRYHSQ